MGIGAVYGFDNPISEADLAQIRTEGNRLAEVLGAAPVGSPGAPGSADGRWRYANPGFHRFGEEVPVDILAADARVRLERASGLISAPDDDDQLVWTFAQRVDERDLVEWLDSKRAGVGRDARLLESRRDPDGARSTLLRRAFPEMKKKHVVKQLGFPLDGPQVAPDFLKGVVATGHELLAYGDHYVSTSGASPRAAVCIEFGCLVTALHFAVVYDQLNLLNTAFAEYLFRRLRMIQKAIARNAKQPDFEGLEIHLNHALDAGGGLTTSAYDRHIAEEQKAHAITLKQTRLWKEEQEALKNKAGGGGGPDKDKNKKKKGGQGAEEAA